MRLHRLSIQNLASLRSDEPIVIDFDQGLQGAPLFAIVGPTGSGKSTILDAIQLALFGNTARLKDGQATSRAPNDLGVTDTRQLISRGARNAHVELEFGLKDPQGVDRRYRATWSCRLPKTNFEAPERTIAEYDTQKGTWGPERGGSKAKDYKDHFTQTLGGMTVTEFNRAVLLAQGEFSALLHAPAAERVALLEKVTQTGVYRDIGARAAQRHKGAKDAYDKALALLGSLQIPPEGHEDTLRSEIDVIQSRVAEWDVEIARVTRFIAWLDKRSALAAEVARAQAAVFAAATQRETHAEELTRLRNANQVTEALAAIDRLTDQHKAIQVLVAQIAGAKAERDALATQAAAAIAAADQANEALTAARQTRDEAAGEIAEAEDAWKAAAECETRHKSTAQEAAAANNELQKATTALAGAESEVAAHEAAIETHDAGVAGRTAALEAARARLAALLADFASPEDAEADAHREKEAAALEAQATTEARKVLGAFVKAETEYLAHSERIAALQTEIAAYETERLEADSAAAAAQLALVTANDHIRVLERSRIFVADRQALSDGDPCPLCGSTSHDVSLFPHDDELQSQIAAAQAAHTSASRQSDTSLSRVHRIDVALASTRTALTAAETNSARAQAERDEYAARIASFTDTLGASAIELGHDALTARIALASDRTERAKVRVAELQAARKAQTQAEAAVALANEERNRLQLVLASAIAKRDALFTTVADARNRLRERESALEDARAALELAQAACAGLLGGRNPRLVRDALQAACDTAAARATQAGEARNKAETAVTERDATLALLQQQRLAGEGAIEVAEASLGLLLDKLGVSRAEAEARRLSHHDRSRLERIATALDRDEHAAAGALKSAQTSASAHESACPEGLDAATAEGEQLAAEKAAYDGQRTEALSELGARKQALVEVEHARQRTAQYAAQVEAAHVEWQGWARINKVIGTSEGNAFAQFAQSLGLEELLWRANEQLHFLNPRYTFVRTGGDLDFGVKDHDQLDGIRPLSTLSGGETFLCSLALALGLARWRVSSIPIETLLLDEGFGTLDADTLNVAMSALQRLCSGGNMRVGVVTHVEAMRERIDARIVVEKRNGGRSTIRLETGLRG